MKKTGLLTYNRLLSRTGFTLTEVILGIGLMAILSAMALPSFIGWRRNLYFKQAASDIANSLKTAKSKAITLNQQYGVQFVPADRSYQFGKYSTNQWVYFGNKGYLSNQVVMNLNGTASANTPPTPNIWFDTNGASFNNYSIRIKDATTVKYTVSVERSGRIRNTRIK